MGGSVVDPDFIGNDRGDGSCGFCKSQKRPGEPSPRPRDKGDS
jgi:hypothetical protein